MTPLRFIRASPKDVDFARQYLRNRWELDNETRQTYIRFSTVVVTATTSTSSRSVISQPSLSKLLGHLHPSEDNIIQLLLHLRRRRSSPWTPPTQPHSRRATAQHLSSRDASIQLETFLSFPPTPSTLLPTSDDATARLGRHSIRRQLPASLKVPSLSPKRYILEKNRISIWTVRPKSYMSFQQIGHTIGFACVIINKWRMSQQQYANDLVVGKFS